MLAYDRRRKQEVLMGQEKVTRQTVEKKLVTQEGAEHLTRPKKEHGTEQRNRNRTRPQTKEQTWHRMDWEF